jgi:hypothetical protein
LRWYTLDKEKGSGKVYLCEGVSGVKIIVHWFLCLFRIVNHADWRPWFMAPTSVTHHTCNKTPEA